MRLRKLLRDRFGLHRAAAERFLSEGRIFLGRQRVDTLQLDVPPEAPIIIDGAYIALNKPEGYVVSKSERGLPTIYDLLPSEAYMLNPVGRLDKDSSGLLLMTMDGLLLHRLTHPKYGIRRGYIALLDRIPDGSLYESAVEGVRVGEEVLRAVEAFPLRRLSIDGELKPIWLKGVEDVDRGVFLELAHGKYREIRRLLKALGYETLLLRRVYYADILLDIEEGDWRHLEMEEVLKLMERVGLLAP